MDFEDDLARMLAESVEELHPPIQVLVAEGERVGVRKRRLRRVRQAAAAATAVAAVVTLAAVTGVGGGGGHRVDAADGLPARSASANPSGSPSGSAPGSVSTPTSPSASPPTGRAPWTEPATAELSWQAMLKILNDQLPPGGHLGNLAASQIKFDNDGAQRGIQVEYDDGHGASTVMLAVIQGDPQFPQGMTNCDNWAGGADKGPRRPGYEKPQCQAKQLPDGSKMVSYITGVDGYGQYDEVVALYRTDGVEVRVDAANATLDSGTAGTAEGATTVTRDKPPLGLATWEQLVQNPQWQFKIPQSLADAGATFAKSVSRLPCPPDWPQAACAID